MIKILAICLGLMIVQVKTAFRDWLIDAALAPVVPIGKAIIKMSGGITKKIGNGVIAYDGDIDTLQRNKTPFKLGGRRKAKKASKKQIKIAADSQKQNLNFINKQVPQTNKTNSPQSQEININMINDVVQVSPRLQINHPKMFNLLPLNPQVSPLQFPTSNQPFNTNVPVFPLPLV